MGGIQTFNRSSYGIRRICKCGFTNTITIALSMMSAMLLCCVVKTCGDKKSEYSSTVLAKLFLWTLDTGHLLRSCTIVVQDILDPVVTSCVMIFMSYLRNL